MTEPVDGNLWAAALDGDRAALARCCEIDPGGKIARSQRIAAAMAIGARKLSHGGPAVDAWRSRLRQVTAHSMMLEDALGQTGRVLGEAEIPWAPLKGLDLASRVYGRPEERPTSDIDLLISAADLETAREALLEAGWQPLAGGPRSLRYLREEGYAWQARAPSGVLVEVHFRLWGSVAAETGERMLERSQADPDLGPGARRLRLADAFVVAAFHLWLDPAPRRIGVVRDLAMISRAGEADSARAGLAERIVASAREFDLELPVALAAQWSASLWGEQTCREAAIGLENRLRAPERFWRRRQVDAGSAGYAAMTLARHLSRRRTRHGLALLAWRRLWAHPGIVETAYAGDSRSFLLLRWLYQLRAWGLARP